MSAPREVPHFSSEAEEADWWYEHREETAEWLEEAIDDGSVISLAEVLSRQKKEQPGGPVNAVVMDPEDVARAQDLAAKQGLSSELYLKRLLHEALLAEEQRLAS